MGRQHNKNLKRQRRQRYLKRKKQALKAGAETKPAASGTPGDAA